MSFVSHSPTYTHIECPRCGKQATMATWKLYSLFRDKGMDEPDPKKMRCTRCGTLGVVFSGRG